jgi:hypothetical protein
MRWLPVQSWRLWHRLKNPSPDLRIPIPTTRIKGSAYPFLAWGLGFILLYYIGLSTFITQGPAPLIQNPTRWERALLIFPIVIFGVLISGAAFSVQWAIRIGAALNYTRRAGMFDLIAASPLGATRGAWLITSVALANDPLFRQLPDIESPLSRRSTLPVVCLLLILLTTPQGRNLLSPFVIAAILYITLHVDYVQCYVLSTLVAIHISTWGRSDTDVRVMAAGAALTIHGLVFAAWVLFALILVGQMQVSWQTLYGLPHLIALYLLREFMIMLLAQRHTPENLSTGTLADVN